MLKSLCHSKLGECLASGEFSDVTIVCGEQRFTAHRVVLSCGSDYFKAMLSTRNSFKESHSPTLTLHEDPSIIAGVISFIYRRQYPVLAETLSNPLIAHAKVTNVAIYYQMWRLERQARGRFAAALQKLNPSHQTDAQKLVDVIRLVYDGGLFPVIVGLRHELVGFASDHSEVLARSEVFLGLVEEVGAFARDVFVWESRYPKTRWLYTPLN